MKLSVDEDDNDETMTNDSDKLDDDGDEENLKSGDEDEQEEERVVQRLSEEELMGIELYCVNKTLPPEYSPDMISEEEVNALISQDIPPPTHFHPVFSKFTFPPRTVAEEDIPLAIMSMMKDLDLIRQWCIERQTLARFILMTRSGYRNNPYHNWNHAFSVTHFAYLLLKNADLVKTGSLTPLEAFAFFVSAICHDVDHRGTNNGFHHKSQSHFKSLYPSESSILESHHVSQGILIIQTEGCNILANLTETEIDEFKEIMRTVILATDIANHFAILHDLQDLGGEEAFDPKDPDHHHLALCLMITASDLSDQTKDWKSAITAAKAVYEEFLTQGDLEKAMGLVPMDMMDRDKAVVTDLQVSFVEKVALPVYKLLSTVFPKTLDAYRGILLNRRRWVRLQSQYNTVMEDPEQEAVDPTNLQGILNALDFEGAERDY